MYALRNTNIAVIYFFSTKCANVLAIMDMASAKSDVNGPKKKACFWQLCRVTKTHKKCFNKKIDPHNIGLVKGFYIFF